VDARGDDVGQPEQGQRRVVAEGTERREGLEGIEIIIGADRPVRQPIQPVGDALRRAVLGTPGERPPADPVLSRLLGREVTVLGGRRREEIFP
jgi:hypothetical protein